MTAAAFAVATAGCPPAPAPDEPIQIIIEPTPTDVAAADAVVEVDVGTSLETNPKHAIKGRWKGIGRQASGISWEMNLEVTSFAPGRCAVVSYDTCAGHWLCDPGSDPLQITAVEHITSGHGCIMRVDVKLTVDRGGNNAKFEAIVPGDTAEAHLERVAP